MQNQGYEILEAVAFDDRHGYVIAHNPNAPDPYVCWQFTEAPDGTRDFYWGNYKLTEDSVREDMKNRVANYLSTSDVQCLDVNGEVTRVQGVDLLPEMCYALLPSNESLILINRGISGYYSCDYSTGVPEINRMIADKKNAAMGITAAQVEAMLVGSMVGWNTKGADPRNYDEHSKPLKHEKWKQNGKGPER